VERRNGREREKREKEERGREAGSYYFQMKLFLKEIVLNEN
jgi:hypothetical protein